MFAGRIVRRMELFVLLVVLPSEPTKLSGAFYFLFLFAISFAFFFLKFEDCPQIM